MSLDSFVGDGLNPSPYKEGLARAERAEADVERLRRELRDVRTLLLCLQERIDAALDGG